MVVSPACHLVMDQEKSGGTINFLKKCLLLRRRVRKGNIVPGGW
jgi:hypothetical protein